MRRSRATPLTRPGPAANDRDPQPGGTRAADGRAHQGGLTPDLGPAGGAGARGRRASPTPTFWSTTGSAAASCASATTSPPTTSCAGTSWRPAAPPMPPASRPPCCTPSRACSCWTWSRAARLAPRMCATEPTSSASCRCCAASTATCPATCAGRHWRSGCSTSCATMRPASGRPVTASPPSCRDCSPVRSFWSGRSARSTWFSATTTSSPPT